MCARPWLAATALVVFAACGNDINGPTATEAQIDITVELDWWVAGEPGFVDARWELTRYDPGTGWRIDMDSGEIGSDGSATIRFQDDCVEGRDFATTHRIGVSGHFVAHEGSFQPKCEFPPVWVQCTSVPQTLGIGGGSPECTPPEYGTGARQPFDEAGNRSFAVPPGQLPRIRA